MTNINSSFSNCEPVTNFEDDGGGSAYMTPEQIKLSYESNPNTNAFTDADVTKLGNIDTDLKQKVLNISNGNNTMAQSIIMDGHRITSLGEAVSLSDATSLGQVKTLISKIPNGHTYVQEETPNVLTLFSSISDAEGASWYKSDTDEEFVFYLNPDGEYGIWVQTN